MFIRFLEGIFAILPDSYIYSGITFQYNFAFACYWTKLYV